MGFYALEYTDVYSDVTEAFSFFVDPNEGLTSFRTLLIPSGGKAESMGNAFTGLADDVSILSTIRPQVRSSMPPRLVFIIMHGLQIPLRYSFFTTRFSNLGIGASIKCLYLSFSEYNYFGENTSAGYYSETIGLSMFLIIFWQATILKVLQQVQVLKLRTGYARLC